LQEKIALPFVLDKNVGKTLVKIYGKS